MWLSIWQKRNLEHMPKIEPPASADGECGRCTREIVGSSTIRGW